MADAIAAGFAANDDTARTVVEYVTGTQQVESVTLPAPAAGAARPAHSYEYPGSNTKVHVAGLAEPAGYAREATFVQDDTGSTVTEFDATAKFTTAVYDPGDRLLQVDDAAGRRSTTLYDGDATRLHPSGRPTESFGPAPVSCFGTDRRPNGTCTTPPVARVATAYDTSFTGPNDATGTAVTGLAATYWPNTDLAFEPKAHAAVDPTPNSGALITADPPVGGLTARAWSGRYVGEVDASGPKTFALALTGWGRLFVATAWWSTPGRRMPGLPSSPAP